MRDVPANTVLSDQSPLVTRKTFDFFTDLECYLHGHHLIDQVMVNAEFHRVKSRV